MLKDRNEITKPWNIKGTGLNKEDEVDPLIILVMNDFF